MTSIDLRTAARDAAGMLLTGQGSGYMPDMGHVAAPVFPSFVIDIKREILEAVAAGGVVTRLDIAKGVGRKKTTWLIRHIEQLVASGHLLRTQGLWVNGVVMFWYEVAKERKQTDATTL